MIKFDSVDFTKPKNQENFESNEFSSDVKPSEDFLD